MGKSLEFRSYIDDDGDVVRFSSIKFRNCMSEYISTKRKETGQRYTQDKFREDVAEELKISPDAIKKWVSGANGPGDFGIIRKMADYMGIDYHDLLVDENDKPVTVIDKEKFNLESNDEKEIVLQMYKLFVDYIYWFTGSGWDSKANKLLENPMKDQFEYITNLFYLLDKSALNVSGEVYYNLRKIITELDQVFHARMRPWLWLPKAWTDLNSFLLSEEFDALLQPDEYASGYNNSYPNFLDLLYDCYEKDENEGRLRGKGYSDEIGHMLFEDMPDYHEMAREIRQSSKMTRSIIDPDTNEKKEIEVGYYDYIFESRCPDLLVLMCDNVIIDDYDFTLLVCREYANTLIKLMKKRFPQYFK